MEPGPNVLKKKIRTFNKIIIDFGITNCHPLSLRVTEIYVEIQLE